MRKYVFVFASAFSLATGLHVHADSNTAVITVTADVRQNCLISTTSVAYGSYDVVGANATAPLDATGTVVLTCTMCTVASLGLDAGANAAGTNLKVENA